MVKKDTRVSNVQRRERIKNIPSLVVLPIWPLNPLEIEKLGKYLWHSVLVMRLVKLTWPLSLVQLMAFFWIALQLPIYSPNTIYFPPINLLPIMSTLKLVDAIMYL